MTVILGFVNQSGGSGKTTTTMTMAALLAQQGKKVTVWDLDSQGDASHIAGYTESDEIDGQATWAEVLDPKKPVPISSATVPVLARGEAVPDLSIVLASRDLAGADRTLSNLDCPEERLLMAYETDPGNQDVILVDCPASLGLLMINILAVVDGVIACIKPGMKELRALTELERTLERVNGTVRRRREPVHLLAVQTVDLPPKTHGHIYADSANLARDTYGPRSLPNIPRSVKVPEAYAHQLVLPVYAPKEDVTVAYSKALDHLRKELAIVP